MYAIFPFTVPVRVCPSAARRLRDAEVGELARRRRARRGFLRREIAVHEAERLALLVFELVGRVQAGERVDEHARRHRDGMVIPAVVARLRRPASVSPSTYSMTR